MNKTNFLLDADELLPIIDILRDGLLQRPMPEGTPHRDLKAALKSAESFFKSTSKITKTRRNLSARDLQKTAQGMVEGYHCLWQRPFPYGLEAGQTLASAVLERPIRDMLRSLQRIVEQSERDNLPAEPLIHLDAEEEMAHFNNWHARLPQYQRMKVAPQRKYDTVSLATAFLLGWWIGMD